MQSRPTNRTIGGARGCWRELIAIALATAVLLTACGDGGDDTASDAPSDTASSEISIGDKDDPEPDDDATDQGAAEDDAADGEDSTEQGGTEEEGAEEQTVEAESVDAPQGDFPLGVTERGALTIGDELIGEEGDATLSVHPDLEAVVLTVDYGDATADIVFSLPHYEAIGATVMMDGEVIDLSQPSVDYPSTAITVEAVLPSDNTEWVRFATTFLAGTTSVEVDGSRAIVRGQIGTHTQAQIQYLIDEHPEVDTLVLADIEGSVTDQIEQTFGGIEAWNSIDWLTSLVQGHGYTTVVPADGQVADSGLLLFAAGTERIVEATDALFYEQEIGAIGVRAACCGGPDDQAHEYDQFSAVHEADVRRWSELLGEDAGTALAMYLVQASVDGPHVLTRVELDAFGLITTPASLSEVFGPTAPADDPYLNEIDMEIKVQRPEELLVAIADAYNASQVGVEEGPGTATPMVVVQTEQTLAYLLVEGGLDDAAGGELAILTLEGDDEFGWVVVEISQRFICRRGTGGGLCI